MEEYHSVYEADVKIGRKVDQNSYEDLVVSQIYEKDRANTLKVISYDQLMKHYEAGNTKVSVEYRRCMSSGDYRWFQATAVLMEGVEAGIVNAFIYSHDINEQMKIRMARERILDNEVDDITIVDIAKKTANVIQIHEGSIIHMGQEEYEKNRSQYVEFEVAEEDRIRCNDFLRLDKLAERMKDQECLDFAYWIIDSDGSNLRKNIHVSYLDSTKADLLLVGRDITALFEKEQQQQLALQNIAEIANQANQAKSDYLSRMSHDMRTPLNAILGLTELSKSMENEDHLREYIQSIDISGRYLLGLINDTLDLSKIESGKMELHEEPYQLIEFIEGINTVIRPLMDAKNIEFVLKLKKDAENIVVDKLRFNQIFYNLLSNAAKYTPRGGHVELESCEIPARDGKHGMRFIVRDTGIGMSKEYLKVLFDPFSQESRAQVAEQKGTGLGLAIMKRIVDLSGGTISVKSEVNKGTEFTLDLYAYDVTEKVEPKYEPTSVQLERLRGIHVLLVDDAEINVMIVRSLLEEKGCHVDCASNGKEAVELFKESLEGYYDIIITDVRMPVMDGLTETRIIRALERSDAKSIPIIGTTADAYTEEQDQTLAAGMNARLVKPIETKLLYATFVRLLEEKS